MAQAVEPSILQARATDTTAHIVWTHEQTNNKGSGWKATPRRPLCHLRVTQELKLSQVNIRRRRYTEVKTTNKGKGEWMNSLPAQVADTRYGPVSPSKVWVDTLIARDQFHRDQSRVWKVLNREHVQGEDYLEPAEPFGWRRERVNGCLHSFNMNLNGNPLRTPKEWKEERLQLEASSHGSQSVRLSTGSHNCASSNRAQVRIMSLYAIWFSFWGYLTWLVDRMQGVALRIEWVPTICFG